MKKALFTACMLFIAAVFFVSCSAENSRSADTDAVAYVRFGSNTRSFEADYSIPEYSDLYWFYTAAKLDGYGTCGAVAAETPVNADRGTDGTITAAKKGLDGTIGPFSQGKWQFTLKAYSAISGTSPSSDTLVYQNDGDITAELRGGETKSIPASVKAVGTTGLLSFRDLSGSDEKSTAFFKWANEESSTEKPCFTIEATNTGTKTLYTLTTDASVSTRHAAIVLGEYDSTEKGYPVKYLVSNNGQDISADISLPTGSYSCRIYAYRPGETAEKNLIASDKSFGFTIYGGATTLVRGDLTENPSSSITFDVPRIAIVQVVPSATEDTKVTASVAPQEEVTASTDVTFPSGLLDSSGDTVYSLEASALSENSASNSFSVTSSDSSGSAKVYGSISLSLNAVKDNTSTAVKDFGGKSVTVSVFIGKGLSDVTVKYVGDDGKEASSGQPENISYDSESGVITFTTTHFSTFVVASTKSALVKNVSTARLYNTLSDALLDLGDTTELMLLGDLEGNTEINLPSGTASLVIDMNGKEAKNISVSASGSVTLRNGKVSTASIKSGDVTLMNTESSNVTVDKNFAGRLTFDGGKLDPAGNYAFIQSSDGQESTEYRRASYVFRNMEISAGTSCAIKIFRAGEIIVNNCSFVCGSSSFISAIDIAGMNAEGETDGTDITITGCTFTGPSGATDKDTGTSGAIKIKSSFNKLDENGNAVGLGNVTIRNNTFTDCVRDVTIGKRDAQNEVPYGMNYSLRTKRAVDAKGNLLTENGWNISGNTSNRTENLIGIAVFKDASGTTKTKKIGAVVGGCTVYDIARAYEARIGSQSYLNFTDAFTAIQTEVNGGTLCVLSDVDLDSTLNVENSFTLDLGGNTITSKERIFNVKKGILTVDNGTLLSSFESKPSSSSVIRVGDGDATDDPEVNGVIIGKDAVIKGPCSYGVTAFGKGSATVTVSGKIESAQACLGTNGSVSYTGKFILNIEEGAELVASGDSAEYDTSCGVYQSDGDTTLNINGGTIISRNMSAVEIRAGKAEIKGGILRSRSGYTAPSSNEDGATTKGAALAVVIHTESDNTKDGIKVTVSGGTFDGARALVMGNPQNNAYGKGVSVTLEKNVFDDFSVEGAVSSTEGGKKVYRLPGSES